MPVQFFDKPEVLLTYKKPCVVMVGGVPGSGKTTLLNRALPDDAFLLSADDYRGRVQERMGKPYDAHVDDAIPAARREFLADLHKLLVYKVPVFIDAAYLTTHSQTEISTIASEHLIRSHVIMVEATLDECLEGVRDRPRPVPEHIVRSYYRQWIYMRMLLEQNRLYGPVSGVVLSRQAAATASVELVG